MMLQDKEQTCYKMKASAEAVFLDRSEMNDECLAECSSEGQEWL